MKTLKLNMSVDINDIARFECKATTGIGYAYYMFVEFKNLLPDSSDDAPRWESEWRRSEKMGSVSVWLTDYVYLKDVKDIAKGAKVRFYLDVMGSKKYCVGTEEFIYIPNSRYQATYDGRGTTLKPYMNYEGRSIFRSPACDDEAIAYYRPVENKLIESIADHVYVKMGHTYFECHGGYDNGKEMYKGMGDLDYAIQTADGEATQTDGDTVNDGNAGIKYGWTGVCHQIANRILWTSQIVVDKAAGYSWSSLIYGPYGRGAWNPIHLGEFKNDFTKSIYELYQLRKSGNITAKEFVLQSAILDFEAHAREGFVGARPGLLSAIEQAQNGVFNLSAEADNELTPMIAERINEIAIDLQTAISRILTDEEYYDIFGLQRKNESVLYDNRLFLMSALKKSICIGSRTFSVRFGQ